MLPIYLVNPLRNPLCELTFVIHGMPNVPTVSKSGTIAPELRLFSVLNISSA